MNGTPACPARSAAPNWPTSPSVASRLALGTAQFGLPYGISNHAGQPSSQACAAILCEARLAGVNALDTAVAYGNSESILGELGVRDLQVITKLPAVPPACPNVANWVNEQVSQALARMDKHQLDGLLLHRPAQLNMPFGQGLYNALLEQKEKGLVRKIGISIYAPQELEALPEGMRLDIVQSPQSIIDQRMITTGWAQRLKDQGLELHIRSIFLQGLLLMSAAQRPPQFARWQGLWQTWDHWLARTGLSPLQACLRYALSLPWPDRIVVGVNSAAELADILQASQGELPAVPADLRCHDAELLNPALWPSE